MSQLTSCEQTERCLGATGLVLMLLTILLKWALLVRVISEGWWLVLALMPLVGWAFGQMVMLGSRWVDEHQLPQNWRQSVEVSWLWPQWLLLLTALALTSGWTLTVLIIATWAWIVWWRKQLGGINLAVALSWVELTELTWLIGLVFVMMP
jgi:cobalamin synthase